MDFHMLKLSDETCPTCRWAFPSCLFLFFYFSLKLIFSKQNFGRKVIHTCMYICKHTYGQRLNPFHQVLQAFLLACLVSLVRLSGLRASVLSSLTDPCLLRFVSPGTPLATSCRFILSSHTLLSF